MLIAKFAKWSQGFLGSEAQGTPTFFEAHTYTYIHSGPRFSKKVALRASVNINWIFEPCHIDSAINVNVVVIFTF